MNPDDWEMWIYNTGVLRARVDGGQGGQGDVSFDINNVDDNPDDDYATVDDFILITYTWTKPTATEPGYATLYVDGQLVNTDPSIRNRHGSFPARSSISAAEITATRMVPAFLTRS